MRAFYKLNRPEKMDATVTITMSVEDWTQLADQLHSSWPSCDLHRTIRELINKAHGSIWSDPE